MEYEGDFEPAVWAALKPMVVKRQETGDPFNDEEIEVVMSTAARIAFERYGPHQKSVATAIQQHAPDMAAKYGVDFP